MNFFHPLFNSSKFQIKHLKALAAAANEIEIKFLVQRVEAIIYLRKISYNVSSISRAISSFIKFHLYKIIPTRNTF